MKELEKCPFCGNAPQVTYWTNYENSQVKFKILICCNECRLSMENSVEFGSLAAYSPIEKMAKAEEELYQKWNNRQ